ncbi:TPA: hypothetical protein N0F65_002632 [Lagenidium giganteum]|uniref:UDENN domain-containing protein n=1 Tax=Lagenidium giganteum TaxID=4803 RepID=A0AAV2Z5L2_9STRA|nr:TPA: hypothetical protein N0F65_002632 [Lagenidium giganteum]
MSARRDNDAVADTTKQPDARVSEIESKPPPPELRPFGLVGLATVVFDIDSGQRLDALHPPHCNLSTVAQKSIAHLALPHSNKQDEGDTQFTVRFKQAPHDKDYLYGFVLFRQQRDQTRNRGYFQKSLVMISDQPFVDLYERALRVVGPLFFQMGTPVLQAVYENMREWPTPALGSPLVLPLAGTYITCIIPDILSYKFDNADLDRLVQISAPSPTGHVIVDRENALSTFDQFDVDDEADELDTELNEDVNATEEDVLIREGKFVLTKRRCPPSPSFGDLLISRRLQRATPYENVGLYSSFIGMEQWLWLLWQFAITGESIVILSPHARTCSQAALAFTSLIAPLKFEGDYRPYYTLYESDFDEISKRQNTGISDCKKTTVIGTTNPFFMKSLNKWPNAIIFPFLDSPPTEGSKSDDDSCIQQRISRRIELDSFEESHRVMLLRRCSQFVKPDLSILRQLVSPPEVYITQTASLEEEPFMTINNTLLRRHFRQLTKKFLRPFEQYFGIWKTDGSRPHLYISAADYLKPFDFHEFLGGINPHKLPPQIKQSKWRELYTAFVQSAHFEPWFSYRRELCVRHFTHTMRALRENVASSVLLQLPNGEDMPLAAYRQLQREVELALEIEISSKLKDDDQVAVIKRHLEAVMAKIRALESGS